jgi:hypothetical protein
MAIQNFSPLWSQTVIADATPALESECRMPLRLRPIGHTAEEDPVIRILICYDFIDAGVAKPVSVASTLTQTTG